MPRPRRRLHRSPYARALRVLRGAALVLVCALVVLEAALGAAVAWAAHTDHELVVITGGSMEPTYGVGSALLVRHLEPEQVQPGVVVTFRSAEDVLTTHRVIARTTIDGTDYVQTQGDANPDPDPHFAAVDAVVGQPRLEVPRGGYAATFLLSPLGRWLVLGLPLLVLLAAELRVLRHRWREDADPVVTPATGRRLLPQGGAAGAVVACVVVVVLSVAAGTAVARSGATFTATATSGASLATATLQTPTGVAVTAATMAAELRWSPSASTFATGYEVWRALPGRAFELLATRDGRGTTSYADAEADGAVRYLVRSVAGQWRSPDSEVVATTVVRTPVTGAYADCRATAADTGGDGNGFETNPGAACGPADGRLAVDANSGTGGTTQCASPTNDRHRFSAWTTSVPARAIVTGIEVTHTGRQDAFFGGGGVCVQLSGDGGETWSAQRAGSYGFLTTSDTFVLGGADDLWGLAWTPAMLSGEKFVVRVTDVSTNTSRDFGLDSLRVRVSWR